MYWMSLLKMFMLFTMCIFINIKVSTSWTIVTVGKRRDSTFIHYSTPIPNYIKHPLAEEDCCLLVGQEPNSIIKLRSRINNTSGFLGDPAHLIWETIKMEAATIVRGDLMAATIMATAVLSQPSFQEAVIVYLANHLKTPLFQATQIRNLFNEIFNKYPSLTCTIALDIMATTLKDKSCPNALSVLLFNKGFHSLVAYRVSNKLWYDGRDGLARYFQSLTSRKFGSDIHPACTIGHGVVISKGTGIVIGETATVGDDTCIFHRVTLGGTGKESGDRHPKVGRGVTLSDGCTVLGNIVIGDGVVVEAGAVVTKPVEPFMRVAGIPAKVVGTIARDKENVDNTLAGLNDRDLLAHNFVEYLLLEESRFSNTNSIS